MRNHLKLMVDTIGFFSSDILGSNTGVSPVWRCYEQTSNGTVMIAEVIVEAGVATEMLAF